MFRTLLFTVVTALLTLPGVSIAALDMLEDAAEYARTYESYVDVT